MLIHRPAVAQNLSDLLDLELLRALKVKSHGAIVLPHDFLVFFNSNIW